LNKFRKFTSGTPKRIVSGGQTGVDRAALDAALEAGLSCGGLAPKGRRAEDGIIPERYPLEECDSADYAVRTELNVVRSDATLILNRGRLSSGTWLTKEYCVRHKKPFIVVQIDQLSTGAAAAEVNRFLAEARPNVLNIAGPRESKSPGIYDLSFEILRLVLKAG